MDKIDKIYSRRRFVLGNFGGERGGKCRKSKIPSNYNKYKIYKFRKSVVLIAVIIIAFVALRTAFRRIDPMFEALCEERLKYKATIITNQQSTVVMEKYKYEELYTVERDETGNVTVIRANVLSINNMISDLTESIQNEFEKMEKSKIYIPFGSLTGSYWLAEYGPSIPISFSMLGTLDTEIKSEFVAQGINQTLHRVWVNFSCDMKVATPLKIYKENVVNQVVLAEHVIVGNIPDTYYNFDGVGQDEVLNVIK